METGAVKRRAAAGSSCCCALNTSNVFPRGTTTKSSARYGWSRGNRYVASTRVMLSFQTATVPDDLAAALAADPEAAAFFETLTGANRYAILYRVNDAKKPETRAARIAKFVLMCHDHETIH